MVFLTAPVACTCRDEAYEIFPDMCRASRHHWQEMLEMMPGAKIIWNEDSYTSREDDVCYCKACRPQ